MALLFAALTIWTGWLMPRPDAGGAFILGILAFLSWLSGVLWFSCLPADRTLNGPSAVKTWGTLASSLGQAPTKTRTGSSLRLSRQRRQRDGDNGNTEMSEQSSWTKTTEACLWNRYLRS